MNITNGPRQNALGIKKTSHHHHQKKKHHRQQPPVIIYTQLPPRIIHTDAKDFMSVVQKLTGKSSSGEEKNKGVVVSLKQEADMRLPESGCGENNDSSSSSIITTTDEAKQSSCLRNNQLARSPDISDIPISTPNSSTNLFCSPNQASYLDGSFSFSPNMESSGVSSFPEY